MTQRVIVTLDQLPDYVDLPLVLYVVSRGFDRVLHKGDAEAVEVDVKLAGGTIFPPPPVADPEAHVPVGRAHPFDGPEVFDDEKVDAAVSRAIGEDFPYLKELFEAKRSNPPLTSKVIQEAADAVRRAYAGGGRITPLPQGEGDWQLREDDGKAGTD